MKIIATLAPLPFPAPRAVDGMPCAICTHAIAPSDYVTMFETDGLEFVAHKTCVAYAMLVIDDETKERAALIARLIEAGENDAEILRRVEVFENERHPEPERQLVSCAWDNIASRDFDGCNGCIYSCGAGKYPPKEGTK